ncbi:hypothetical protein KC926_03005 [Candidatus Kaiserbacteria bacterium]|nr:hypothetical protein [Candidatus Kaiserbacteria bacterium]
MDKALIGLVSGAIVAASIIPYSLRTYRDEIKPVFTSWFLFTVIGLATLLTYQQTGAEASVWPALFGFINPLAITIILIAKHRRQILQGLSFWDNASILICCATVVALPITRQNNQSAEVAMFLVLFANLIAVRGTVLSAIDQPHADRPVPWFMVALGFGLSTFAINSPDGVQYWLPIYMVVIAGGIASILCLHRIKNHVPIHQWV